MSNSKDQNSHSIIFNFTNHSPVTHTIFPELPKFRPLQGLTHGAGVVEESNSLMQELDYALGNLLVQVI
jgi:hypothetical protein